MRTGKASSGDVADRVREYYDLDAGSYAVGRWHGSAVARANYAMTRDALLLGVAPNLQDEILEVGCGSGTWTQLIAERCSRVVALDISGKMLARARAELSVQNVTLVNADFAYFECKRKFDKVFSVRVFEHLVDQRAAVEKMFALLGRGGVVVIVTKTRPSVWSGRTRTLRLLRSLLGRERTRMGNEPKDDLFWIRPASPWRLQRLLTNIGFREVRALPVIWRPPIFAGGENEYPIMRPPADEALLQWFVEMARFVRESNNRLLRSIYLLLTESYVAIGRRPW